MSTTTLTFSFRVGGVLTDVASAILSDPTSTYGVRRTDTGGTVIAAGTAMTHQSTGVYAYAFTDPASGLTYQWVSQWINPSGVTQWSQFTAEGGVAGTATGYWTSQAAIERYLGSYNAAALSNLNNDQTGADYNGFLDAVTNAESEVNYELALFGYPTGKTNPVFPSSSFAFPALQSDATVLASAWIYSKRGFNDDMKALAGAFAKARKDARSDIRRILRNRITDVPRGFTSSPEVVISPVVLPYGSSTTNLVQASQIPVVP